jgi:hydrogenase 3 maturation protease
MKKQFRKELKEFLSNAERISILCVGNEIKGDDAAGIIVSEEVAAHLPKNVFLFIGGSLPENYTGPIRKKKPTHVLLVDAAEFEDGDIGDYGLFDPEQIQQFSFTTHSLPLSVFIDFLRKSSSSTDNVAQFKVIGIKPKVTEIDDEITPEVEQGAKEVSKILIEVLHEVLG